MVTRGQVRLQMTNETRETIMEWKKNKMHSRVLIKRYCEIISSGDWKFNLASLD